MRYQIIDSEGQIVDTNLTHEEALLWTDQSFGNRFTIVEMKGDD